MKIQQIKEAPPHPILMPALASEKTAQTNYPVWPTARAFPPGLNTARMIGTIFLVDLAIEHHLVTLANITNSEFPCFGGCYKWNSETFYFVPSCLCWCFEALPYYFWLIFKTVSISNWSMLGNLIDRRNITKQALCAPIKGSVALVFC